MTFSMLPGDPRQAALGTLLRADGHEVVPYSPGQAADFFVFPLPTGAHPALSALPEGSVALAALPSGDYPHLRLIDYYRGEALLVRNAAITAEGALGLAMAASDRTLWGSRALVAGYGRIGRALSARLLALGAHTTVYARKEADRAWAAESGCETLAALPPLPQNYDFIFNTVPALVFAETPEAVCVELASPPGGFRSKAGVIAGGGLPGRTAPLSAALALREAIYRALKEENLLC